MLALLAMLIVIRSAPGLCDWPQQHDLWAGHTAGLSSACWLHTELLLLTRVCVSARAALPLQQGSCLPYFFTPSLPLIIINKNDDMIFLYPIWKSKREWGRERNRVHRRTNCPSPVACILFMSVTYSMDTDIKTAVTCWYTVDMAGYRLLSGLFLLRAVSWCSKNCKKLTHEYTRWSRI